MANERKCPDCGNPIPAGAPAGFCPLCEMAGATRLAPPGEGAPFPGQTLRYFGDYELLEEIARGGMGVVYKARQVSLNRVVAVKMILAGQLATAAEVGRFRAEARAAAGLQHANIVPIYEVGDQDGQNYFSMEFVDGPNLAQVVRENPLPAARAAGYARTISEAVQYAHERGVLHRDLKPSNVLIDPFDQPRVTDFGLAKRLAGGSELTETGQVLGTPSFVPPEQAAGRKEEVGPHSDVYALGAILYHLLTGRPPFAAETVAATLAQVLNNEPAAPRSLNATIPRDLETICLKCLEKDPYRRYPTAKELSDELGRFQRGEPIHARPAGRAEKVWRWCRRKPALAGSLATAVLLLLGGIVASTWQARRARTAEREQTRLRQRAEGALTQVELQHAEALFAADDAPRAVAQLASVLARDRSNRVAAERLLSALTDRSFSLPLTGVLGDQSGADSASSPDGLGALDVSDDTARRWDAQTGQPLTEPLRHEKDLSSAQFNPDGLRVLTVSTNTAQVWDALTGKPLTEPLRHDDDVDSAQFGPDGLRVLTVSSKTAQVWDAHTGKPLTEPLRHQDGVDSARFSPDGLQVLTVSSNTAQLWDVQTGKPLTEPLRHEHSVDSAQFSPDGLRLLTVSSSTAQLWDAQTGKPLAEPLGLSGGDSDFYPRCGQAGRVDAAQFSPDGVRVLVVSNCTVRVWDAQSGKPLAQPLRHKADVISAEFSPDGLRVVTASADMTARVWDAQTGKPLTQPLRHEAEVMSAEFSPDGLRVVTASLDTTARVWDAQTGQRLTESLGHGNEAFFAHFSRDGLRVLSVSHLSGAARVWDARTGKSLTELPWVERGATCYLHQLCSVESAQLSPDGLRVRAIFEGRWLLLDAGAGKALTEPVRHEQEVGSSEFSPDGLRVLTVSGNTAWVWDARTGKRLTELLGHEQRVQSAQFSRDGLRVLTVSGNTARVWDAQTGKPLTEPLQHEAWVRSAGFSPDSLRLVTVCGKSARVWDARTGKPLTEPLRHEAWVRSAGLSPDSLRLVTVCGKSARVWDAQTGKPLTEPLRHEHGVDSAQFSPDGLRVLTVSSYTAQLWDAQSGKPLTEPLLHKGIVNFAQFSPDGVRLVTASEDKTGRVWDARTGKPLTEPLHHGEDVDSATFSRDGLRVLTVSSDTARVWDALTGKPLTELLGGTREVNSARFSPDGLRVFMDCGLGTWRAWDAQTGYPLTEPLRHGAEGLSGILLEAGSSLLDAEPPPVLFSPDGLRALTISSNVTRLWEMNSGPMPVPPWLPELAVAAVGRNLAGSAVLQPDPAAQFLKLKEQLRMSPATDFYTRWARWFLADRATRTISPFSSITVPEYVRHRVEENTLESLREATLLSPTNGLAFARLARVVAAQEPDENPNRIAEADFYSRHAARLSPKDGEVLRIRAEIEQRKKETNKP